MNRKPKNLPEALRKNRSERGAALLMVLLLSMLLLATGGALLLSTSLAARTAIDSASEMQAYYGAEAGLQRSLSVLRGHIAANVAMGADTKIDFRKAVTASAANLPSDGSTVARLSGWLNYDYTPAGATNPDRVALTSGYAAATGMAFSVVVSDPDLTAESDGEPVRLLLQVTGYGPKGAVKQMELVVNRTNFDFAPPSTILMRSSDDGTPLSFTIGDSAAKEYSGHDHNGTAILPSFGATSAGDTDIEIDADTKNTVEAPIAETVANSSLPPWLRSAAEARAFLADQKANAVSQGRYFPSFSGSSGSIGAPAFTFVDGDCNLDGGAGLLIVTGDLILSGNPSFDGLILVLGDGTVNRNGGGNGDIYGAIVVASFDLAGPGDFRAPFFNTDGGGTSKMQYDSVAVRQALNVAGPRVWGVHEY